MAATVYAPTHRGDEEPEIHEFGMIFLRGRREEIHHFSAYIGLGWQDLQKLTPLISGKGDLTGASIDALDRVIRRGLRDDDGTPIGWTASIADGEFTDPNGDTAPAELLPAYEAFDAWSSKRRWLYLMDEDDDLTIEPEQILALVNDLIRVAGNRPTRRSAPSPR
jgi:hypothetical protein